MPEPTETTTETAEELTGELTIMPLPVGDLSELLRSEGIGPLAEEWKPGDHANYAPFSAIRVLMDAALTENEVDKIAAALQYALKETVWAGPLAAPTTVNVDADANETELVFPFHSSWVGRDHANFNIAWSVSRVRILLGSKPLLSNRLGPGTYCTQEVEGLGKDRCGVEFFVR